MIWLILGIILGILYLTAIVHYVFVLLRFKKALNFAMHDTSICESKNCKINLSERKPTPKFTTAFSNAFARALILEIFALEKNFVVNEYQYSPGPGLTVVKQFFSSDKDKPFGILLENQDLQLLLFRGSISDYEKQLDLLYQQVNFISFKCHAGFLKLYSELRAQIHDALGSKPLVIGGHSLGGAVASLCMVDLFNKKKNCVLYTFGSPRVFDPSIENLDKSLVHYRVFNTTDVIPTLPSAVTPNFKYPIEPLYYLHFGDSISFSANWKCGLCNHLLPVYYDHFRNI
jgi:triacylglycerol lipase